jgi:hypothetical protein
VGAKVRISEQNAKQITFFAYYYQQILTFANDLTKKVQEDARYFPELVV